jgi:small subunit ribosomal protein S9
MKGKEEVMTKENKENVVNVVKKEVPVKKKKASATPATLGTYATGRRKEAVAKVWIFPGGSGFDVNGRSLDAYFERKTLVSNVMQPLVSVKQTEGVRVRARVSGGGISGQAGALRHGLARALQLWNAEFRRTLKQAGFLTRDPRMKERKKYGRKRARKSFQYSKR